MKSSFYVAGFLTLSLLLVGCGTRRRTDTPRTASEQLLVSAAIDQATAQLDFSPLRARRIFIDTALVDRVDKDFLVATVRMHAWRSGALITDNVEDAQIILEVRSGAVGIDSSEYLLGIPSTSLPTPFGTAPIPEAAVFKSVKQIGASRVSFTAYDRDSRRYAYTSGPFYGFSDQRSWWLMGAGPSVSGNVLPERTQQNTATVITPGSPPPGAVGSPDVSDPHGFDSPEYEWPAPGNDAPRTPREGQ